MAITFSCSKCTQDLRIADDKAGRKVKCPSCGSILVVPRNEGIAANPAAPNKHPVVSRPTDEEENGREKKVAPRSRKEVDEADYEVVKDDPPPARTRPRKKVEEEDDVVVEDDVVEEEPPPSRKRPRRRDDDYEDEDDERPASSRRRRGRDETDEDEEDDNRDDFDRRRRLRKKRKKSGNKKTLLLVLGLGGGGLVLLLGVGLLLWLFVFSGSGLGAEMKYVPDDCTSISSERVDQMRNSKFAQAVKKEIPGAADDDKQGDHYGLVTADIDRITRASGGKDHVTIITLKKSVNASDIKSKKKGDYSNEKKVGNYTIYGAGFDAFCVPESKIVVYGPAETLEKILKRDKKPELSENMKKALGLVDFSKSQVHASAPKGDRVSIGNPLGFFGMGGGGGGSKSSKGEIEAMGSEIHVSSDFSMTSMILFKDTKDAADYRKEAEDELKKKRDSATGDELEMLKNVKVGGSGAKVTVSTSMNVETFLKIFRKKGF